MKYCFCFFLSVLSFTFSPAQTSDYKSQIEGIFEKVEKHYLKNQDSLVYYLNEVKRIASKNHDVAYLFDAYNIECWAATYYEDLELIRKNIKSLDSLSIIYKNELNNLEDNLYYKCQFDYTKGQYYFNIKDFKKSRIYFQKIISTCENLQDDLLTDDLLTFLVESNMYLGTMHMNENKHLLAKNYFERNVRILENKNNHKIEYNNSWLHIANIYSHETEYRKANSIMIKSIPFYLKRNKNSHRVMVNYHRIIKNYINLEELDSAKIYLKMLKEAINQDQTKSHRYYDAEALIFESEEDYSNALKALTNYLEINIEKWNHQPHSETAIAYNKIGNLHLKFNQPQKAIINYDMALVQFSENSINSTIGKTIRLEILKNKSTSLNTLKNHNSALETSENAISILDSLKPSFSTQADKLFLVENAFPLFENGIEAAFQLYQESKNPKRIDDAFFYSEKSKSSLLLESLLSTQASNFANIPDDLIENERQLKAKITYLENQINKAPSPVLQDELFTRKQDHRNLIEKIEVEYKNYYDLKYNTQVISLDKLQNWLDDDVVLISYFYGNNTIYSIAITNESKDIQAIEKSVSFETELKATYALLSNPKSDLTVLQEKSKQLYQKLLEPSLKKASKSRIIIVPDGLLNYLPFESLIDDASKYVIENHAVSYINSATLLLQLQKQKQNNHQVLAFAPSFENATNSVLLPIPNNIKEVEQVQSYFKGEIFINENASLHNFYKNNTNFGIIHLATHAILDDKNPEYSYLAFSPETSEKNLLYVNDIYNLELTSNMVTLSACETGLGDLKKGEGMMSLARGFYFSGASSIASTLWKVNDASTSNLMDNFYRFLSEGNAKDSALQNSKLAFLKANKDNPFSHPYYWSGFIISGNTVALSANYNWVYVALGIFGTTALLFFIFRRKRTA